MADRERLISKIKTLLIISIRVRKRYRDAGPIQPQGEDAGSVEPRGVCFKMRRCAGFQGVLP
ncbi:MAG: hypothetical protein ACOWYE_16165 [Desulfatiglandales bacterium]